MSCRICGNTDCNHLINLFVCRSEGLELCHPCEMALMQHVRDSIHMARRACLNSVCTEKKEGK